MFSRLSILTLAAFLVHTVALSHGVRATSACPNISVISPLYIYPTSTSVWQPLVSASTANPSVPLQVIINPNSGPAGSAPDSCTSWSNEQRLLAHTLFSHSVRRRHRLPTREPAFLRAAPRLRAHRVRQSQFVGRACGRRAVRRLAERVPAGRHLLRRDCRQQGVALPVVRGRRARRHLAPARLDRHTQPWGSRPDELLWLCGRDCRVRGHVRRFLVRYAVRPHRCHAHIGFCPAPLARIRSRPTRPRTLPVPRPL
jgi:hypothetical protein